MIINISRCFFQSENFDFLGYQGAERAKNGVLFRFLLVHFNSFFDNYLFFKFINKCQKEILRCAPPSSHVYDFYKNRSLILS